jgi:hypothetical protein
MSQRECAGFNWPQLPVATGEPLGGSPETVNEACRGNWSSRVRSEPSGFVPVSLIPGVSFQSRPLGVAQPCPDAGSVARCAKSFRSFERSGFVARFACPPPSESCAFGVGHAASFAFSRRFAGGPPFLPGIARPAIALPIAASDFSHGVESNACGLGHEVQSLPDVRRPDARSA